jgi:hypothetical protein
LTTGIALSYLVLAMFKTPLTAGKSDSIEDQSEEIVNED